MQGRRIADGEISFGRSAPGDYGKARVRVDGRSFEAWWFRAPDDHYGRLSMPDDVELGRAERAHHVEEHDDGSITIVRQPNNSNSIKSWGGWHGYIRNGVWEGI